MTARIYDHDTGAAIRGATDAEVARYVASFGYVPETAGELGVVTGESIAEDLAGREVWLGGIDPTLYPTQEA